MVEVAEAIEASVEEFKRSWIIARLEYKTPLEAFRTEGGQLTDVECTLKPVSKNRVQGLKLLVPRRDNPYDSKYQR